MKVQRHLAPTAAPLSITDCLRGVIGLLCPDWARRMLAADLKTFFGMRHVFLLTSGKAALATILNGMKNALPRCQVVIPAYTCYSVPSAVHKAGLEVVLCDVDPHTLDYNLAELRKVVTSQTLAIVVPHLLGRPADMDGVEAVAKAVGAFVIEDAAQAMGGASVNRLLGTRGDVGFFSLGRGKNVSSGSGGIVLTNSDELAKRMGCIWKELSVEPLYAVLGNLITVMATKILLNPLLYWIPAGLPFLGLGETKYDPDFPVCRMDGMRAGLLSSWKTRLEQSNKGRMDKARLFETTLPPYAECPARSVIGKTALLRFPVLMPTEEDKTDLCRMAREQGLGVSGMYPAPVSEIPVFRAQNTAKYVGAQFLASRLITLPLHWYVTKEDVGRISEAFHGSCHRRCSPVAVPYEATSISRK